MTREAAIGELNSKVNAGDEWDLVIIGGGATGLGAALEAVTRGYKTLLVEQSDFAKSTSSKSTKLVHGGVRYLAQGDVALVREASIERGLLTKNAPHLVHNTSFVIPAYSLWDSIMYTVGLKLYDWMAGRLSLGRSRHISKRETLQRLPTLATNKLSSGILYHDGQFDDSRLAINLVQTIAEHGGLVLNYMKVTGLQKNSNGRIEKVKLQDVETNTTYEVKTRGVINATGVFADDVLRMDNPEARHSIAASQGVHLVLDREFLPGNDALMIPKTSDGRVLFAVPWHNKVVVGTTDTPVKAISLDPEALEQEISFILATAGAYLSKPPQRADVRSVWAGLRPLAAPQGNNEKTKEISRSHKITVSPAGLITIIGGKWTTFRKMAEDVIDKLEESHGWPVTRSVTDRLPLHGATERVDFDSPMYFYGADAPQVEALAKQEPALEEVLSSGLGIIKAQVIWAARNEMARTVEDVLARRIRALFLDAREAVRIAPQVAAMLAAELGYDQQWEAQQLREFNELAKTYMLN
ncbi:glycerol-3-phosphate dehydrogenase/oxidase [Chitinophaga horti]|uniref:Glycerol-3-phosphate dehydrogenase/oxidase n=1 Tax=Chitinophaga horti TaxID=2920382 RepID=A0ABY6J1W5_9BACT|nr:glycerol-3-phosphate dehydrogenase/oxidase [Chitinophaga horti]UYQ93657.1 glycerol-3-phosphate dehydrogenase/oxidase [Chitinophaga horti]